jgi:hypothetical protein
MMLNLMILNDVEYFRFNYMDVYTDVYIDVYIDVYTDVYIDVYTDVYVLLDRLWVSI